VDTIENTSIGTDSACSLHKYGQMISDNELMSDTNEKDPAIIYPLEEKHVNNINCNVNKVTGERC